MMAIVLELFVVARDSSGRWSSATALARLAEHGSRCSPAEDLTRRRGLNKVVHITEFHFAAYWFKRAKIWGRKAATMLFTPSGRDAARAILPGGRRSRLDTGQ
jgi:hypothetical protein